MLKMLFFVIIFTLKYMHVESQVVVVNNTCLNPEGGGNCYGVRLSPMRLGNYGEPLYTISAVPLDNSYNYEVDNICEMYLPIGNYKTVLFRSTVFIDGSYLMEQFIEQSLTGFPNGYRSEGISGSGCTTCVWNTYIISALEGSCSGVYAYYKCPVFGDCVAPLANIHGGIFANRPPEDVSTDCYEKAVAEFNSQGSVFAGWGEVKFPNRLARRCVTSVNGVPTIGAETVSRRDSVQMTA